MKNLLPGDKLLLKLTTIKQGSYATRKSLDLLEGELPEDAAQILRTSRQLPSMAARSISEHLSSIFGFGSEPEPTPPIPQESPEELENIIQPDQLNPETVDNVQNQGKPGNSIKSDVDLVEQMKALKPKISIPVERKNQGRLQASDFYLDDEDMPMGASFTVNAPDIQL